MIDKYVKMVIIYISMGRSMNITVNIPDNLLTEASKNANMLHMKRSEYIRKALENMNKQVLKNERYSRLKILSQRVKEESVKVNSGFAAVEHDPEV